MKRSNPSIVDATGKSNEFSSRIPRLGALGALEFVAALNGEDANGVLIALKRFTNTVRNEKREALGISFTEDDLEEKHQDKSDNNAGDDEEADEEMNQISPPEAKKKKKNREEESWMKDSKSYNVPFVGTSVAKGDTGKVVVGQWPTGLLEKYLERSPFATELTGEALVPPSGYVHRSLLSRNEGKLSHAIHLAYLEALSQLVTAAVPTPILRRSMGIQDDNGKEKVEFNNSSNIYGKLLTPILNERLEGLVDLIKSEVGKGANTGNKVEKLSDLTGPILHIFMNLAATSITSSRRVIRILDEKLTEKDLRVLLRAKPVKERESMKDNTESKEKNATSARTRCILLVAKFLEWGDTAILSSLTRIGSKERKIQPGMLHSILKFGLIDGAFDENRSVEQHSYDQSYFDAVGHLLSLIRNLLPSDTNNEDVRSPRGTNELLSKRSLADLFSGDALQRICHITARAPPLSDKCTHEQILCCQDTYDEQKVTRLELTGAEARRLLFPLLSCSRRSPFLYRISNDDDDNRTASLYTQHVVRCLSFLLKVNNLIPTQKFISHCLNKTPKLQPALFRVLPIPDPKQSFTFMSCSRLVCRLLKGGPLPWENLTVFFEPEKSKSNRAVGSDFVLLAISPLRMKKNILVKGLQSANTLVVLETLKLISAFLERYQQLETYYKKRNKDLWGGVEMSLVDIFLRLLPDMQALLAVRSRFDPFSTECENPKLNTMLTGLLCRLIALYAKVLPRSIDRVKFDWMKLLPDNPAHFVECDPWLQLRLLDSLDAMLDARKDCSGSTQRLSSNACRSFLSVVMASNRSRVYNIARKLSFKVIFANFCRGCTEEDQLECFKYESYLWIDGITWESLDEFCLLFEKTNQGAFQHAARIAEAWLRESTVGYMEKSCISPLLSSALAYLPKSSKHFHLLTCQVATKSLLYHCSPLPLASLICLEGEGPNWSKGAQGIDLKSTDQLLVHYSRHLLDLDVSKVGQRSKLLTSLISAIFAPNTFYFDSIMHTLQQEKSLGIFRHMLSKQYDFNPHDFQNDVSALLRNDLHTIVALGDSNTQESFQNNSLSCVTIILSMLLQNQEKSFNTAFLDSVFRHPLLLHQGTSAFQSCLLDILALGNSSNSHSPHASLSRKLLKASKRLSDNMANLSSEDGLFRCKKRRVALQNLSLLTTLDSKGDHLSDVMQHLLRACSEGTATKENHGQMSLHGSFALNWMQNLGMKTGTLAGVPANIAFRTWRKIAGSYLLGPLPGEISQVCYFLEGCLGRELVNESESRSAAVVYALCLRMPPKDILSLCLASKYALLRSGISESGRQQPSSKFCLLSSLLRNDFRRIGPEFMDKFVATESEKNDLSEMVKAGILDEAMSVTLESPDANKMRAYSAIANCFVARICRILNKMEKIAKHDGIIASLSALSNVDFYSVDKENLQLLLDEMTTVILSITSKTLSKRDAAISYHLCKLGCALTVSRIRYPFVLQSAKSLASATLTGLCFASQQCLRRQHRRASSLKDEHDDYTIRLMNLFENFFQTVAEYDQEILQKSQSIFLNFLRVCLKYGITDSEGDKGTVTLLMLKAIRLLMVNASHNNFGLSFLDPNQIFMMAASHSKFSSALSGENHREENTGSESAKVQLIYLLLCCISLSKTKMHFDKVILETFLKGYTAGVGIVDIAMRRLIHLYVQGAQIEESVLKVPFTDQLRWGKAAHGNIVSTGQYEQGDIGLHGKNWEWLLNHIEMCRIRSTLSQFPVWDQLVPPPLQNIEWINVGQDDIENRNVASNDENVETCKTPNDEINNASIDNRTNDEFTTWVWQGNGRDIRYSPAFLLPLILRMVDSSMGCLNYEYEAKDVRETGEDESIFCPTRSALAQQVQQLCDKGVLALCLASLSCRCPSLRQLAIAILYHFSRVLDWKEAHDLTSWRERPQLLMVLSSLQRGLVARKAERTDIEPDDSEDASIPLIPAVSAIFLARASLIIAKPGDSLYAPLNRYFLRIKSNFGAYNDLYRLPAFISLFCSSADEGQARRERLWALQQLKDGFVDKFCYRAVVSCHAPELVMTSFRGYASWHRDKDELLESILLIETLITLVKNGGKQAIYHLTVRLGLLSWIRTILVGRPTSQTLSSIESQITFLHLVSAIVHEVQEAARNQMIGQKTLLAEIESLARPVLHLYRSLATSKGERSNTHSKLITAISGALASLKSAKILLSFETGSSLRSIGMPLSLSTQFLSAVSSSLLDETVWSFCILPLDAEMSTPSDATAFCVTVLECAKQSEHLDSVLECVYLLTKRYKGNLDEDGAILNLLLNIRGDCRGSDVWLRCISNLVPNQNCEMILDVSELAIKILEMSNMKLDDWN